MATASFFTLRNLGVDCIGIPIIQRDFAQGRSDSVARRIRVEFLDALIGALGKNSCEQSIDFIYGEVIQGSLIPLDGQQRLTTLFLLHWYLASRLGLAPDSAEWCQLPVLSYMTRSSSTAFCKQLATCRPPFFKPLVNEQDPNKSVAGWIKDQSWFAKAWGRDPTITGMLVVLDELNQKMSEWTTNDLTCSWSRLTNSQRPAIHFEFLSITGIGSADNQYIRMNARGKPLTPFERFKARFEDILGRASPTDRTMFEHKIDGAWTDLLWPLRGSSQSSKPDNVIDDKFLRLFRFIGQLTIWKFNLHGSCSYVPGQEAHTWAEPIYGPKDTRGDRRAFLIKALDTLHQAFRSKNRQGIEGDFAQWFSAKTHRLGKVTIFADINLLEVCVINFGESTEKTRFPLARQLLFYSLLYGWAKNVSPDVQRLRVLRNLLMAPDANLRAERMADELLPGVEYLIDYGLPSLNSGVPPVLKMAFGGRQLKEEITKTALKAGNGQLANALERLEDHPLLQGCLYSFDLQAAPQDMLKRVDIFYEVFPPSSLTKYGPDMTGAMLTKGDYSLPWRGHFQFGSASKDSSWRLVLCEKRSAPSNIQKPLAALLDDVASRVGDIPTRLMGVINDWLSRQKQFDWRFYLVKYDCMRNGLIGRYYSDSGSMGFDLCMWQTETRFTTHEDPFLTAVVNNIQNDSKASSLNQWFWSWGDAKQDSRWLRTQGGAKILRSDSVGWVANPPDQQQNRIAFFALCRKHQLRKRKGNWVLEVPQGGTNSDRVDRIELGRNLLEDLLLRCW